MADLKDDIERYRKGELTSAQMHALEKRALSDPFLADALEGAELISPEDFSTDVSDINQKLEHKKSASWFTPLRIAAGVVLLAGSVFFIYNNSQDEQLALQKESPAPESSSQNDTIKQKIELPKLLSLNKTGEEAPPKTEIKVEPTPTVPSSQGSGTAKPATDASSSEQIAIVQADDQSKLDELAEETMELTKEDKALERESVVALEPSVQDLKKEIASKDIAPRAAAKKSSVADVQPQRVISGQVTSLEDNMPLPGVNVMIKGTTQGTVTDIKGNYSIPVENENQKLVFSFIGLQTSEVSPQDKSEINIKLAEDISQLSEVVVTGQGFKTDLEDNETPVIKLAEPFGGRKAYDRYLENSLRYPQQALENKIKGKVLIEFTVGTSGALRDFNVIKSLGYGCDDEVIRLVKEGPRWTPSTEDHVAIESNVRVRMKFDPAKAKN